MSPTFDIQHLKTQSNMFPTSDIYNLTCAYESVSVVPPEFWNGNRRFSLIIRAWLSRCVCVCLGELVPAEFTVMRGTDDDSDYLSRGSSVWYLSHISHPRAPACVYELTVPRFILEFWDENREFHLVIPQLVHPSTTILPQGACDDSMFFLF